MQTFLPYPNFVSSAKVLDTKRLGKQRVECKQILLAHFYPDYGWQNHPATNMWRGYSLALARYSLDICIEWRFRGYQDSLLPWFTEFLENNSQHEPQLPPWLGDYNFHASHRGNLMRKNPNYYGKFCWDESPTLPYVWPVN